MPEPQAPRPLSLVTFDFDALPAGYHAKYPFKAGRTYVFLGELVNMPGHCVVAEHPLGRIHSGYHTENFRELPEEKV